METERFELSSKTDINKHLRAYALINLVLVRTKPKPELKQSIFKVMPDLKGGLNSVYPHTLNAADIIYPISRSAGLTGWLIPS